MPSPGISFGDLMVFIAVVLIVVVFLAAVRSFLRRAEEPAKPDGAKPQAPEKAPAEKPRASAPQQVTSTPSASR